MTKTYVLIDLQNRQPAPEHVASRMGANGEAWVFYAMLTINANLHPLMSRMHKIERDSVTKQLILDKRSVVPLETHDFDRWLTCTIDEAREMLLLPSVDVIEAGPASDGRAPEAEDAAEA